MHSTTTKQKVIIVIPARMESKRLPGKPLLPIIGEPMLQHTYDVAKKTKADAVYVTTPDEEILQYCNDNSMPCILTLKEHSTGTHRIAEAARRFCGYDLIAQNILIN